jgi:hypothetical protein
MFNNSEKIGAFIVTNDSADGNIELHLILIIARALLRITLARFYNNTLYA